MSILRPLYLLPLSFLFFSGSSDSINLLKKLPKPLKESYVFVPTKEPVAENVYYISKTEVSHAEYNAFLTDLLKSGREDLLAICRYDSNQWKTAVAYNEPYAVHYHRHPAYEKYPAVNISHEAAEAYCQWLTEKHASTEEYEVSFRLPTKKEWTHAANGSLTDSNRYAWGNMLRNKDGQFQCNFTALGAESISVNPITKEKKLVGFEPHWYMAEAGKLNDIADVTAPVHSYWPNGFGIYNMNGNVAEMISEKSTAMGGSWGSGGYDVRNTSEMHYEAANPFTGFRVVMEVREKKDNS